MIHHRPIAKRGGSKGGFLNVSHRTCLCMVVLCMDTTTIREKDDM